MLRNHILFILALITIVFIGFFDYLSGAEISMMLLYAVPILGAAWYCGRVEGIVIASLAAASWFMVNITHKQPDMSEAIMSWNAISRLGIFMLIAYTVSLQAQLKKALEREQLRANTDRLTGLLNKGAFKERVEEEMNRAQRYHHPLTLAFIDLDNFKQVNDTHGHASGDKLLQLVSEAIHGSIRHTDFAGRIGGDEFTLCFPETDEVQARKTIRKLVEALDIMISQHGWQITASIGVVTCMEICSSYDDFLGKADKLMYAVKGRGKNAAEFITVDGGTDQSAKCP